MNGARLRETIKDRMGACPGGEGCVALGSPAIGAVWKTARTFVFFLGMGALCGVSAEY